MKKLIKLFSTCFLLAGLSLTGCRGGGVPSEVTEIKGNLDLLGSTTPITSLSLPAKQGDIELSWTSNKTNVISIPETPTNGFYVTTVTRPAVGQPEAQVSITGKFQFKSKVYSHVLTYLVAPEVPVTQVTVADIKGSGMAAKTAVNIRLTVTATYMDAIFGVDSEGGTIMVYCGADGKKTIAPDIDTGDVVDVTGVKAANYEIIQISNDGTTTPVTITKVAGATPFAWSYVAADVDDFVDSVRTTQALFGKTVKLTGIISSEDGPAASSNAGTSTRVYLNQGGKRVELYYKSKLFRDATESTAFNTSFVGKKVTIDLVCYTHNSSYDSWQFIYDKTNADVIATEATDAEKMEMLAGYIRQNTPTSYMSAGEYALVSANPTLAGSSVEWSIDGEAHGCTIIAGPKFKIVTIPDEAVSIKLVASYKIREDYTPAGSLEVEVTLAKPTVMTVAAIRNVVSGTDVAAQLTVVTTYSTSGFIGIDAAGDSIYVYKSSHGCAVNDVVVVTGKRDIYWGLVQIGTVSSIIKLAEEAPTAFNFDTVKTPAEIAALPHNEATAAADNKFANAANYGYRATVTGKLVAVGSNYDLVAMDVATPAVGNRVRILSQSAAITAGFADLVGIKVNVKLATYTYHSTDGWQALAAEVTVPAMTDSESLDVLEAYVKAHTDVSFDTLGTFELPLAMPALNDSAVTWTIATNDFATIVDNQLVIASLPANDPVDVKLTANIVATNGGEARNVDIDITFKKLSNARVATMQSTLTTGNLSATGNQASVLNLSNTVFNVTSVGATGSQHVGTYAEMRFYSGGDAGLGEGSALTVAFMDNVKENYVINKIKVTFATTINATMKISVKSGETVEDLYNEKPQTANSSVELKRASEATFDSFIIKNVHNAKSTQTHIKSVEIYYTYIGA